MKKPYSGCIPSLADPRDYSLSVVADVEYPAKFNVADVPIYDQGNIGRCVMEALRSAPHAATGVEPGATFGYGYWRSHSRTGMIIDEACNGFVRDGIPPRSVDSADLEMPEAKYYAENHKERLLKAAEPYKGWQWARANSINEIKAVLWNSRNNPGSRCIVGLPYVRIHNGRWMVDGPADGHHAMAIVGWDDEKTSMDGAKGGFILRNSWGTKGGFSIPEGGYLWCAYDDILCERSVYALIPPAKAEPKPEPAPTPEPAPAPKDDDVVVVRTLRLTSPYMRGDDVKHAQERLIAHGYSIAADGVFGPATYKAVREFQAAKKLTIDGIVGKNTLAELDREPTVVPPAPDVDKELRADFIAYLYAQLGNIYCWGGNGEAASDSLIDIMENSSGNKRRAKAFLAKQKKAGVQNIKMYDCSGLISRWLQDHGMAKSKRNCDHLWAMCKAIGKSELQPCDLLFRGSGDKKTHVGVYMGNGMVIEARGRDYGVVIRPIDATKGYWTCFGRLTVI